MPKFEVTYTVTKADTYTTVITAKDADSAEEKAQALLETWTVGNKFPGDMDDESVDFEIDSVKEL